MHSNRQRRQGLTISGLLAGLLATTVSWQATAGLPDEETAPWTLQEESGSIRIYTTPVEDSSFRAFKAVGVLDAPIENIMAVMVTPESCLEWAHNCAEARAVGDGNFHNRLAYSATDMPWPVSDRDYVLRLTTEGSQGTGQIIVRMSAVPDQMEEKDGRVRVDESDTLYRFTPEGEKTRMVWLQHTDPKGALPGWLVNSLLVDIPLKSMEALEETAHYDHYRGFELVWDQQGRLANVRPPSQERGDDDETAR
jgi:hypothetical protein